MLSREDFVRISLENNLFWLRIMKEHAIFIEDSLPPSEKSLALESGRFKQRFESLLSECVKMANGWISPKSIKSRELYTRYTDEAERLTAKYTGIAINRNITKAEMGISPFGAGAVPSKKEQEVVYLNQRIINNLKSFANFKANLLNSRSSCRIYTSLYTTLLGHLLHEANEYLDFLINIQKRRDPGEIRQADKDLWNRIMSEHATAIRGMLDPAQVRLFDDADRFARIYDNLTANEKGRHERTVPAIETVIETTEDFSDYKEDITKGIVECKIKAAILPLFADHLLREANHYLRLLRR